MRAVLPAVLSAAIVLFGTNTSTASNDPDVARLVALVNAPPAQHEMRDVRDMVVRIGKDGRAKHVRITSKTERPTKALEEMIKNASFSPNQISEKKIELVFREPNRKPLNTKVSLKASQDRHFQ